VSEHRTAGFPPQDAPLRPRARLLAYHSISVFSFYFPISAPSGPRRCVAIVSGLRLCYPKSDPGLLTLLEQYLSGQIGNEVLFLCTAYFSDIIFSESSFL